MNDSLKMNILICEKYLKFQIHLRSYISLDTSKFWTLWMESKALKQENSKAIELWLFKDIIYRWDSIAKIVMPWYALSSYFWFLFYFISVIFIWQ